MNIRAKAPLKRVLLLAGGLLGIAAGLQLSTADGADSPSGLRAQADALRAENSLLGHRADAAWLSAISLDTRLRHTRSALVGLEARIAKIARRRAEAQFNLHLARRALLLSQERLAARLQALYQEDQADPVAVLLESESIGDVIERLDSLDRVAVQDRRYLDAARSARERLSRVTRELAEREAEARRARDAATATAVALEGALSERAAFLARLRAARSQNSARASGLDSRAQALAATQLAATPSTPPTSSSAGRRTLTVTATGYSIRGRTSTGVSAAWGIVAVDPSVIPLGTRMAIPGYGEGIAADTGGSVAGARIDLWFPTVAEALAWGTRSVTITLR